MIMSIQLVQANRIGELSSPPINETSVMQWNSETEAFRFTGNGYWFEIKPTVQYQGIYRDYSDIRNAFPLVGINNHVSWGYDNYKFYIQFNNVPISMAQNIDNFRYELTAWSNLTLNDLERTDEYTISIHNGEMIISFQDLIDANYTVQRDGPWAVNIYGGAQHFINNSFTLDPTITSLTLGALGMPSGRGITMNHIFVDPYNDRVHRMYSDSAQDIHSASAPLNDYNNWTDAGSDIISTTVFEDDFDCDVYDSGTQISGFCVGTRSIYDYIEIASFNLTGTSPFIEISSSHYVFDSSDFGGEAADDAEFPKIRFDSNNCGIIVFYFEDDSLTDFQEMSVALLKENSSSCGTGNWAENDFEYYNMTIFSQEMAGYSNAVGMRSFGDDDMQLVWHEVINGETADINLATAFFNGTSNTIGNVSLLNTDVEDATTYSNTEMIIGEDEIIVLAINDTITDVEAYLLTNKNNGSISSQVDTGLNTTFSGSEGSRMTGVWNPNSSAYFAFVGEVETIWVSNTTDGITWSTPVAFITNASEHDDKINLLTSKYNPATCEIYVSFYANEIQPSDLMFHVYNATGCDAVADEDSPSISSVITGSATNETAKVYIDADENFNVTFNYGTAITLGTSDTNTSFADPHNHTLTGLINNTFYYLNITTCDSSGNCGYNGTYNFTTLNNTAADSCTYTSGDWNINCADNCQISSDVLVTGMINTVGSGTYTINTGVTVSATDDCNIINTCDFNIEGDLACG